MVTAAAATATVMAGTESAAGLQGLPPQPRTTTTPPPSPPAPLPKVRVGIVTGSGGSKTWRRRRRWQRCRAGTVPQGHCRLRMGSCLPQTLAGPALRGPSFVVLPGTKTPLRGGRKPFLHSAASVSATCERRGGVGRSYNMSSRSSSDNKTLNNNNNTPNNGYTPNSNSSTRKARDPGGKKTGAGTRK